MRAKSSATSRSSPAPTPWPPCGKPAESTRSKSGRLRSRICGQFLPEGRFQPLHFGIIRTHRLQFRDDHSRFADTAHLAENDRGIEERLPLIGRTGRRLLERGERFVELSVLLVADAEVRADVSVVANGERALVV